NLTGNVTGDVTGNLTGNVTGAVTGNVTGNLTGNVTGDVTGNATNVTGIVAIANGGTGSNTQNFVDLTANQSIGGHKTFTSSTASPLLVKPSAAPAANTKLIDLQATGAGGSLFSVDAEGDVIGNSFTGPLTGAVTGNVTGNLTGAVTGNVTGN